MAVGVERIVIRVYPGEISLENEKINSMVDYLLEGVRHVNNEGLRDLLSRYLRNRIIFYNNPKTVKGLLSTIRRIVLENQGENSVEKFTERLKLLVPISQDTLEDDNEEIEGEYDPDDYSGGKRKTHRRRSSKRRSQGGKRITRKRVSSKRTKRRSPIKRRS
jgi:hypothetical protein